MLERVSAEVFPVLIARRTGAIQECDNRLGISAVRCLIVKEHGLYFSFSCKGNLVFLGVVHLVLCGNQHDIVDWIRRP